MPEAPASAMPATPGQPAPTLARSAPVAPAHRSVASPEPLGAATTDVSGDGIAPAPDVVSAVDARSRVAAAVLATPARSAPTPISSPMSRSATSPAASPVAVSSSTSERQPTSRVASVESRADSDGQARPSEKAPPAQRLEVVEKAIGSPFGADKNESLAARGNHPAALPGATAAVSPAAAANRPAFVDADVLTALRLAGHHAVLPNGAAVAHAELPWSARPTEAGPQAHLSAAPASSGGDGAVLPVAHVPAPQPPPLPFALDAAPAPMPAAALMPAAPGPLLAYASDDLSLRATVMPERAVLSLDTGAGGELALHLRIKDGVTDVHVSGEAAASLDVRPQDLRAALASEGLTLGSFESGQSPPQQSHVDSRDEGPAPHGPSPATPGVAVTGAAETSPLRGAGRGVHVTA